MAQRVLTPQELAEIDKLAKQYAKKINVALKMQINKMDLRSRAEVFQRMSTRNKVNVHLAESFKARVVKKYGTVQRIQWSYNWYGIFHDVGTPTLPARNWSSKAINPTIKSFQDKITEFYSNAAVNAIVFTKTKNSKS